MIDHPSNSPEERSGWRTDASFCHPKQEFSKCRWVRVPAFALKTLTVLSW